MKATIARSTGDVPTPVLCVWLTSSGMQTEWVAPQVGDDEQRLLLRHLSERHRVIAVRGRGRTASVSYVPGVPGFADHLHAALARLPSGFVTLDLEGDDPLGREVAAVPAALRFKMNPTEGRSPCRIVRRRASGDEHVCDLRRSANGDVHVENANITDIGRKMLLAHFRIARAFRTGGQRDGVFVTVEQHELPGTVEHFVASTYALPAPFVAVAIPEHVESRRASRTT